MITPVMPTYARAPFAFVEGEGAWLTDETGRRFLDFGAGIAVNALGHAHPALVHALTEQARRLWHVSNLYRVPGQERLAAKLVDASFADTVFFTNSGAEAMECSLKMARKYQSAIGRPERWRIITVEGAFHGRTLATISAAAQPKLVDGFGPLLEGFDQIPFGDHDALRAAIGPETAAICIEPVQGEGGVRPLPMACLRGLRALCDEHELLLIYDEIQCGVGRTGKLFAHEWAGPIADGVATPDIMAIAKGIGGGFPLGACLATERAAVGMTAGSHGSTFGGNPLAAAVGAAVLDVVLEDGFLDEVARKAALMRQRLEGLSASYPDLIDSVRGLGLMLGIKCKIAPMELVEAAYAEQLLLVPAGDNVARVLPPLTVSDDEIAQGVDRIERALSALRRRQAA